MDRIAEHSGSFFICGFRFLMKYSVFISFSTYYNNYKIFSNFLYHIFNWNFFLSTKFFQNFLYFIFEKKKIFQVQEFLEICSVYCILVFWLSRKKFLTWKKWFPIYHIFSIKFVLQLILFDLLKIVHRRLIFLIFFLVLKFFLAPYFCNYFSNLKIFSYAKFCCTILTT